MISRKSLLSGDIRGKNVPLRPPWAVDESKFDDLCTNCGDCVTVCPVNILSLGRGRLPVVSFVKGECDFCGECESACKANALDKKVITHTWDLIAKIDDHCLALKKITCRTCEDQCDAGAIKFKLKVGGVATPKISADECTGCGACFAPCPANSITIEYNHS
ncbi:MAG: ferredoxin-type protein NapF [Gammaproteobacteria bacterium]|nr:ferredoxin-type protein NapF [Gammaproteobacteria bacterium]